MIPLSLASVRQFVNWKVEVRDGKPTKAPINPHTGNHASVIDPTTWGTLEEVVAKDPERIGFVFTGSDPFVAVDLDGCRNAETGEIAAWAQTVIKDLSSYTEISPSGTGVHILLRGTLPAKGRKRFLEHDRISEKQPALEVYAQGRFFTLTGQHLPETPADAEDRQSTLTTLYARYFGEAGGEEIVLDTLPPAIPPIKVGDRLRELIEKGWHEGCGFPSPSELDFAVATEMLRNGHSPAEVVWVFTHPTFGFSRGKHRRADYLQRTIAAAQAALRTEAPGTIHDRPRVRVHSAREIDTWDLSSWVPLIDRLIFPTSLTMIAGEPYTGKTFLAMQMMAALASGLPFLDEFAVPKSALSLMFVPELPPPMFQERWRQCFKPLYDEVADKMLFVTERGVDIETDLAVIAARVEEYKPQLVVLDPLVRFHHRKENAADEMSQVLGLLDKLIEKYELSVLLTHHAKKPGPDSTDVDPRGSGVFRSHPHVNIGLVKIAEESGDYKVRMEIESNFADFPKPIFLRRSVIGLFEIDGSATMKMPSNAVAEILRSVSDQAMSKDQLVRALRTNYNLSRGTAFKQLSGMLPPGIRVELREGIEWFMIGTDTGEEEAE